jgi:hypothetical protein
VLSDSDDAWDLKLQKYARLGVRELVSFDPEGPRPVLRIWDRLDNDLVERELVGKPTPSLVLPGYWVVVADPAHGPALRLSRDEAGESLFPTQAEAEAEGRRIEAEGRRIEAEGRRIEAEGRRIEAEGRRIEAEGRRIEAEARAALEAELRAAKAEIARLKGG